MQAGLQSLAWAGAPPDRPHLHPEASWWSTEPVEQQRLMVLLPGSPHTHMLHTAVGLNSAIVLNVSMFSRILDTYF